MHLETEILVVGGGPSGSVTASRLARLGHRVTVAEAAPFPRPHIGESLPPSILPLLDHLGLRERVERAGFLRPRGAVVQWGGKRWERSYGPEAGFQVHRGWFDELLLRAAAEAGVAVLQPALADRPVRCGADGWRVPVRSADGTYDIRARFVVDATGKRFWLGGRKARSSPPTLALYGYWTGVSLRGPETIIEAGAEQWYWAAALPDGTFNATVFLDPARCRLAGRAGETLYRQLLAASELLAGCLAGQLTGPVQACSAATYVDDDPVGDRWLKVGEAGLGVDPLSSQGVQLAMTSGLQGAAVVHTILSEPAHQAAAVKFYRDSQRDIDQRHRTTSAAYYGDQALTSSGSFWKVRAGSAQFPPQHSQPHQDKTTPQPEGRVRLSRHIDFVEVPVLRNDLIRLEPAVTHPNLDRPVAYLDGVPLAALLHDLDANCMVKDVLVRWAAELGADRASAVFGWVWQRGLIIRGQRDG